MKHSVSKLKRYKILNMSLFLLVLPIMIPLQVMHYISENIMNIVVNLVNRVKSIVVELLKWEYKIN